MKHIAFCTFGCRINQYDTETLRALLEETGRFRLVPWREAADVYVVNTCSVTAQADATARKAIRRIRSERPAAKIVVTGCYAQRAPEEIAALPGVASILGVPDRAGIVSEIEAVLGAADGAQRMRVSPVSSIPPVSPVSGGGARAFPEIPIRRMADRSRAVVKIQDGCNGACSFCIIPQTRGRARSREPARVVEEIRRLVDSGHGEIVLAGVHLGDYGQDGEGMNLGTVQSGLVPLIKDILAIPGLARLRLSSIGVNGIGEDLIELMASHEKFARHFHIPLQSGSDEILSRMNRGYGVAQFEKVLGRITDAIPDCGIGTDIICGFPGESDALFRETVARITALPFHYLHPFPYSARPGSLAESFGGQVPNGERKSRARILKGLSREKTLAFARRHVGRVMSVLLEGGGRGNDAAHGWTDNYLRVTARGGVAPGLHRVRITGLDNKNLADDGLVGEIDFRDRRITGVSPPLAR